MSDNGLGCCRV
jgi:hypothetical protein